MRHDVDLSCDTQLAAESCCHAVMENEELFRSAHAEAFVHGLLRGKVTTLMKVHESTSLLGQTLQEPDPDN